MMLAFVVAAAQAASPVPRPDVVVIGQRVAVDALAACLARGCSPDEEAAAALAAANEQYLAGDYRLARRTVGASLARLRGRTRDYPDAVADLLDGAGRLDAHLGAFDAQVTQTRRAMLIVRDAYGPADRRAVERRMAAGEALLTAGLSPQGLAELAGAVADAGTDLELMARARLRYAAAVVRQSPHGDEHRAVERILAPLLADATPVMAGYRLAARAVVAKMQARRGDDSALAAVAAELAPAATAPVMVAATQAHLSAYQQDVETCQPKQEGLSGGHVGQTGNSGASTLIGCGDINAQRTSQTFEKQWLDVGFTIAPDGHVGDVAIARQSGQIEGPWIDEVLHRVRDRHYAAMPGRALVARRERYTLTARYILLTGSRVPVREARPVIEVVDISADRTPYLASTR